MKTILRMPQLIEKFPVVPSTIYKLIQEEGFPPPIKLTKRCSGWDEAEVNDWIENRIKISKEGHS